MSKVAMVATFTCAEGKNDEMDAALAAQVAAASELEGVEVYSYHRGEGSNYSFFALFTSMESLQAHGDADSLKEVMPAFMSLLGSPPQMSMYSPVAAAGLDL
ncbi:MAG: antibiotic biosynthesis monooxygenase [Acidimicrobiaceae bacterium]|nr:antibiotic biosynthesis monooxygenase [Acidimicrobiaceae bacterium]MDE0608273.1 antibiotic biosynthesis monooxygenase [Acidimicrobiaceae bacterium]